MTLPQSQNDPVRLPADIGEPDVGREVELLSHDIRSAVSDVIGGLRLLEGQEMEPKLRDQLSGVHAASELLARLIEDALVLVSGERQQPPLSGNLHLRRLLRDMERRWAMRAQLQGVAFEMHVAPDVPDVVQLDRLALQRILANLIGNAVKYAADKSVSLFVALREDQSLRFCVEDTGPGFSELALKRLFASHGRPEQGALAGSGLGLHISKQIADSLGADLTVANRPEGGAQVALNLPYVNWHGAVDIDRTVPDLSAYKILVADDSETNQLLVSQMLASMGAECELAGDGVEALNWLARERFDLALIDIEMPRLGGLEVMRAEQVRQAKGLNPAMPMVAMTAYVLRDNRDAIYAAGADGLLAKPLVSLESFGHALLHYIRSHQSSDILPEEETSWDARPTFDEDTLQTLLEIAGPDSQDELLDRLTEDLQASYAGIAQALEAQDVSGLRSHTHVLLSLSSAVGAHGVHMKAEALNAVARKADLERCAAIGGDVLKHLANLQDALAAYVQDRCAA